LSPESAPNGPPSQSRALAGSFLGTGKGRQLVLTWGAIFFTVTVTAIENKTWCPTIIARPLAAMTGLPWVFSLEVAWSILLVLNTAVLLAFVRYCERQPWYSIGIRMPSMKDVSFGLLAALIDILIQGRISRLMFGAVVPQARHSPAPFDQIPFVAWVAFFVADALLEEIGNRAYVIERVATLTGSVPAGALLSFVFSVAFHLPSYGFKNTMRVSSMFLLLIGLYVWRRNVPCSVLAHVLINTEIAVLERLPPPLLRPLLPLIGLGR